MRKLRPLTLHTLLESIPRTERGGPMDDVDKLGHRQFKIDLARESERTRTLNLDGKPIRAGRDRVGRTRTTDSMGGPKQRAKQLNDKALRRFLRGKEGHGPYSR